MQKRESVIRLIVNLNSVTSNAVKFTQTEIIDDDGETILSSFITESEVEQSELQEYIAGATLVNSEAYKKHIDSLILAQANVQSELIQTKNALDLVNKQHEQFKSAVSDSLQNFVNSIKGEVK